MCVCVRAGAGGGASVVLHRVGFAFILETFLYLLDKIFSGGENGKTLV